MANGEALLSPISLSAAADGTPIANYRWSPGSAETVPRRGIYLLHGLSEYAGRYGHVAAWLAARGWEVAAHDHRGHGRSGGPRATIPRRNQLVLDAEERIAAFAAELQSAPIVLGHSMGGLIATLVAFRQQVEMAGLVLCSPAFRVELPRHMRCALKVLSVVAPNWRKHHDNYQPILTHDPVVTRQYLADPLVNRVITPRLAAFICESGPRAVALAPRLHCPTLLLVSGDDRVVSPEGSRAFAASAPKGLLTLRWYDDAWHELLNEAPAHAGPVFADLDAWLGQV